jgi:hypothetical protein
MATNKLTYNGVDYENEITANAASLDMQHAMVGELLAIDVLTIPVITGDLPERFIAADQTADDWFMTSDGYEFCAREVHATPQFISNGAGLYYFEDTLIGKYFLNELHQTGQYEHEMTFYSAIRLLDRSKHFGGLYTGETVAVVLADIMGDVAYTVDGDIAAIQIYGYLPYASRRSNLQYLLMAIGGAVRNNVDGTLRITALSETITGTFDTNRVFLGASIVDKTPATAVQVTEHNYIESTDVETLYDSTSITTETITFSEPHHDYVITNGSIVTSGVNYVTFTGAGAVTITGEKYVHITRIITVGTTPTGAETDNVQSVTDNTLLSPNNAADVAEIIYDYLSVAQSIEAEVVFGSERPGDVISIVHPYTEQLVNTCIKLMGIEMGLTELRASSEFLIGYIPPSLIAGFENYDLLTDAGNWTVPAGVTKIRVILVGGGTGGTNGAAGADGTDGAVKGAEGVGGAGGEAGEGGAGAYILEINIPVTPAASLAYSCAAAGGNTTFDVYSSALGRAFPDGYFEPKSGLTFAADGTDGTNGAVGGDGAVAGEDVTYESVVYTGGDPGETNVYNNIGGVGGGGGGAAVGSNGTDGEDGVRHPTYGVGGDGGAGASASIAGTAATNYGQGGGGGHGGGGGGGGGSGSDYVGQGGNGGSASAGGAGYAGCVVIYY